MSVRDIAPPVTPAPPSCPRWCAGDHSGDYAEQHRLELGRVAEGELALIVAIVSPTEPGGQRTVELSWEGTEPGDTDHYLMESIELDPSEVTPLADLLEHANTMLKARPTL